MSRGLLAGRAAWLAHPLFGPARKLAEVSDQLTTMVAAYPGQHWIGRDPHEEEGQRPIDVLEQVDVPVLVLVGEHDVPGFLDMSAVLARRIPGARHHVVADAGHMINMEQPARQRVADPVPRRAPAHVSGGRNGRSTQPFGLILRAMTPRECGATAGRWPSSRVGTG